MGEFMVLRLIHVIGGMLWVGSGVFTAVYMVPALTEAGPAAGLVMSSLKRRHMFVVLPSIALLTVLSGLRLMWITSAGFSSAYFATGTGITFGIGGAAAIVAFLLGVFVGRPAGARIAQLGETLRAGGDPEQQTTLRAELQRVQRRSARTLRAAMFLLIIAAASMAVARYVP
ncbi:MAG: hypothetical protein WEF86_15255 [Gemmatimonadota bacterium]